MRFETVSYERPSEGHGKLSVRPDDLENGRLSGTITLDLPERVDRPCRYILTESQDILVAPYDYSVTAEAHSYDSSVQITGSNPKLVLEPDESSRPDNLPTYLFRLPDITTLHLCQKFFAQGLTDALLDKIYETYDHSLNPLLGFIKNAKYGLDFSKYMELYAAVAAADDQVQAVLNDSRHGFIKNITIGKKAGKQFPIRTHSEFVTRTTTYESYDALEFLDRAKIIENLIDDMSQKNPHLDDICHLEQTFIETAADLSTGFFVHLITEALLSKFSVATETSDFTNGFRVRAWPLIQRRYQGRDPTKSYNELREIVYENHSIEDCEQALAAVTEPDSTELWQALADLLYWYTDTTTAIPEDIQPKIYATAATLYNEVNNEFMAAAARYQANLTQGNIQRDLGNFQDARLEFFGAREIGSSWKNPLFNDLHSFVKSVLTDIEEYREQGDFMQAFEKAESGYTQLVEGDYQNRETETAETLLNAWKADLQAQNQRANGQFDEAIRTTNDAIRDFRIANADGPAQTAQARRYQLQAIQAQLELEFDKAVDHHQKAREQAVNMDTSHVHKVEANLCMVKNHLLEKDVEGARKILQRCNQEERCITNLGILIDVYADYTADERTPINEIIEQLDTSQTDRVRGNRHISYHGDYISAVVHVVAAQRLRQQNIPPVVLNHITQAAIKNAISGGSSYEWAEISELSHVDAGTTWRLRIPTVIQSDLEYVEYNAKKSSFPNYAAPGMKLLAALEGYLRVLVEYYAKREYGAHWQDKVINRGNLTLGDIYKFFKSDAAADRISARSKIYAELNDLRYFSAKSNISDVRNDLDHDKLSWLDEKNFAELKDHVFEIMRRSAFDCPIIAEIREVTKTHEIYFASTQLKWNRVPRRPEISTTTNIEDINVVYLPPDPPFDSGMVKVPAEELEICELDPKREAE